MSRGSGICAQEQELRKSRVFRGQLSEQSDHGRLASPNEERAAQAYARMQSLSIAAQQCAVRGILH
jgi:hypothetical protein